MATRPAVIARPGHELAAKVAAQRQHSYEIWFFVGLIWLAISIGGGYGAFDWLWRALCVWLTYIGARSYIRKRRYRQLVHQGHIVKPDSYLFTVWDQLLTEAGLTLTDAEQQTETAHLFDAALDLQGDLAARRSLKDRGVKKTDADRRLLEARIRARLAKEVKALQERRDLLASLLPDDYVPPPALTSGVTEDEVAEQLRLLQAQDQPEPLRVTEAPPSDKETSKKGSTKKKKGRK